jgi:hypothetical protein
MERGFGELPGKKSGWRLGMMRWPNMWGPHVRERKREKSGTGLGGLIGPRLIPLTGPKGSRRPFFFSLSFFFFCFLISFITFATLVQFASNQLLKISKVQGNKIG